MASMDAAALAVRWSPRLGELRGELLQRLEMLSPIAHEEIEAVERSPMPGWAYSIKVIESERKKIEKRREEKVRTKDGETITATEKEFRRLFFLCPHDAREKIMSDHMVQRIDLPMLTAFQQEEMFSDLRNAIAKDIADNDEKERACRERGQRNLAKLRAMAQAVADRK